MVARIDSVRTFDVRFPTSLELDGSDAVNVAPDYSAAYVVVRLDSGEEGHAFVFTLGRGNDIVTYALQAYGRLLEGADADVLLGDLGGASARLIHDSQMRWLGPEKGVSQMACGALVNALWDLRARRAGKPLWLLLTEMSPEEIVSVIDFKHIRDTLTPDEALAILRKAEPGKIERIAELQHDGYPAYTTGPGWLGYTDEKLLRLARQAADDGFELIKLKVGRELAEDRRRISLVSSALPDTRIAVDANQAWEVADAISWMNALSDFDLAWIEEPTSTDDILGHTAIRRGIAPIPVATGEAVANRIVFKQFLQAQAIDILQLDATRVGGINENLATILLAAKFGVPVCPHAGGVGLCELAQHFAFFDYAAVSRSKKSRYIEYVDNLHSSFAEPAVIRHGRYQAPQGPGTGAEMLVTDREKWTYPDGPGWTAMTTSARHPGSGEGRA